MIYVRPVPILSKVSDNEMIHPLHWLTPCCVVHRKAAQGSILLTILLVIRILWVNRIAVIELMDIWSTQSFSHAIVVQLSRNVQKSIAVISMGYCKKDVTPLLRHWSYVFLVLTHRLKMVMRATRNFHRICERRIVHKMGSRLTSIDAIASIGHVA